MSYRVRPLKYARTTYKWWTDRATWFAGAVEALANSFLLMETGDFLLLEDGDKIILE